MARRHEKPSLCSWWRIDDPLNIPPRGEAACFLQQARFEFADFVGGAPRPLIRLLYLPTPADVRVRQDGTAGDTLIVRGMPDTIYRVIDFQLLNANTAEDEIRLVLSWTDQRAFPIIFVP